MTGTSPLPPSPDADDIRKHLDFIQAIVARMAGASAAAKDWLLPVVSATFGFALVKHEAQVAVLGILAVLLFAFLDANYLRQEKAYRGLYDTVARQTRPVVTFSLDPSDADDPIPPAGNRREKLRALRRRWFPDREVWLSWSVAPFYGALLLVGLWIAVVAAGHPPE